jgi:hypothetical protein
MNGWRKMDRQRGFLNETTGQRLVVSKKEFGSDYVVLLFSGVRADDKGKTISPAYATASKAEAYALSWMEKHSKGTEPALVSHSGGGDENE